MIFMFFLFFFYSLFATGHNVNLTSPSVWSDMDFICGYNYHYKQASGSMNSCDLRL